MNATSEGFLNLNKPADFTSHDAVNIVRRVFHMRKVGHGGTLDPMAVGVLPVALGRATKFIEYLADCDKTYLAEFLFGITTDSGDIHGKIIESVDNFFMPTVEDFNAIFKNFVGKIEQTPPKFSAIKINGRKAYELARKNIVFELPRRIVTINHINILNIDKNSVKIEVDCSKGTYIRSLAVDIGKFLNLPATLKSLQRIRVGNFFLKNSVPLDELTKISPILPIDSCLTHFKKFYLPENRVKAYCNGLTTNVSENNSLVRVYSNENFLGIGKIFNGELKSEKLVNI